MRSRIVRLLGGVLVATFPLGCGDAPEIATAQGEIPRSDAESITIDGELFYTNAEGVRLSQIHFDTAYQWVGITDRDLRGVLLVVFNEDGTERARLTSERGEADFEGRQMKAIGNVVLNVTADGRRIESEELNFNPYDEQIWSDSAFVMSPPGQSPIRGCSFTSDLNFRNFESRGMGC